MSVFFVSALSLVSASAATVFSTGLTTLGELYASTVAGNFTATNGDVDMLQATGPNGFLCVSSATCIDLNGSMPGTITSGSMVLGPGTYVLTFTLDTAQRGLIGKTQVTFGTIFNQTYTDPNAPGKVTSTFTLASTTTAELIFKSLNAGTGGNILSNVSITTAASAVPEPGTLLLMSLPLLAFGARFGRKR